MNAVRRLGKTPAELGNTTGVSGSPDILELDDGAFAVIGVDITDRIGDLDVIGARCAPDERVVRIPRNTLTAAKTDIPEG
ncbi:hypothetical protein [Actinoallomurus sp. NPDC050550]|uniref:hypothetical protein n=1 Tax=Actinoallomurus sp. NPDC050550 TaxID=3154937 RepID=UPI00340BA67C